MKKRGARVKPTDPLLRAEPWRVSLVFDPIEAVLSRLEIDGTITTAPNGAAVFIEPGHNEWYDTAEALRGIVEFHEIASNRRGEVAHIDGLRRLAELLAVGGDVTESDIAQARADIAACKRQAFAMRRSEAESVVKVVSIGVQLDLQKEAA